MKLKVNDPTVTGLFGLLAKFDAAGTTAPIEVCLMVARSMTDALGLYDVIKQFPNLNVHVNITGGLPTESALVVAAATPNRMCNENVILSFFKGATYRGMLADIRIAKAVHETQLAKVNAIMENEYKISIDVLDNHRTKGSTVNFDFMQSLGFTVAKDLTATKDQLGNLQTASPRIACLEGMVSPHTIRNLLNEIDALNAASAEPVLVAINSPGGCCSSMMAAQQAFKYSRSPISTVCFGQAASAAAILLASGTRGKRAASANATLMFHDPTGTQDVSSDSDTIEQVAAIQHRLISEITGATEEQARAMVSRDFYATAQEAAAIGLIDQAI